MTAPTMPATDRVIAVPQAEYECGRSKDKFSRPAYTANISTDLVDAPEATYDKMLSMVPDGYRIGLLEPIAELRRLEEAAREAGKSVREALKDQLFARFITDNPFRWERTGAFLRAPKGAKKLCAYVDSDADGRKYVRADFGIGDKVVAEGVRFPLSHGGIVVEINPVLLIPAVVANGKEPNHTMHTRLSPDLQEVGLALSGYWYDGEDDRCLNFDACWPRSYSYEDAAFRVVQGLLDEVPLPSVEYFVKDRESYERGLADGEVRGLEKGREVGRKEVLRSIKDDLDELTPEAFAEKYKITTEPA
ncbi:MAG: hypothetical protein HY513_02360 [Candidatus Aenigmarchaeota archaeon]|nr:hypothetical protein [Candidatus Aenigmarchaeota archaeon]